MHAVSSLPFSHQTYRPPINEAQEIRKGGGLLAERREDYHLDGTD